MDKGRRMRYAGAQGRKPVRAKAGAGNRGNMELPGAPRRSPRDPRTPGPMVIIRGGPLLYTPSSGRFPWSIY